MLETNIKGIDLSFETEKDVFSPRNIDAGTLGMLSVVDFHKEDKVLDLGCGYGVVGILAAKLIGDHRVVMIDKDPLAIDLSHRNALLNDVAGVRIHQSDGLNHLEEKDFTIILSNPPYHADFAVPKGFIEKGFNRLQLNGRMFMVTKRKDWYKNKLISIFGGVKIWEIDDYFVFMSIKNEHHYAKKKRRSKRSD